MQPCSMDNCDCEGACGMCEIETEYIHLTSGFVAETQRSFSKTQFTKASFTVIITESLYNFFNLFTGFTSDPKIEVDTGQKLALIQSFRC